jgi:glycosyltransferase involved in cell wall biosynthesis
MMRRIVLISYTPKDAGGGVPRWNRDFIRGFPGTVHYSWTDFLKDQAPITPPDMPEWDKAKILNAWLKWAKLVTKDDIIIADGFWGTNLDGFNVISVAHGIWSHLTKEDVDAGKTPEFPAHHAVQVEYRRRHLALGGKIVAVSDFISRQMKLQWNYDSEVINNAIDLEKFVPAKERVPRKGPLIIHGVTTGNKGFDHIETIGRMATCDVMVLDDAQRALGLAKYESLSQADLVVQPSAYEGNSYFVLETLACGVPIVAYNVGLLNSISEICHKKGLDCKIGCVIDRKYRSPQETLKVTKFILESVLRDRSQYNPREVAQLFSLQRFHEEWRDYLERYEKTLDSGR